MRLIAKVIWLMIIIIIPIALGIRQYVSLSKGVLVENDESKFVIYREDEIQWVKKTISEHFEYVKNTLSSSPEFLILASKASIVVLNTGAIINHTLKIGNEYVIFTSFGSYRRAMALSILYQKRNSVKNITDSSCIKDYFSYVMEFDNESTDDKRLAPRIDKYVSKKCPDLASEISSYANEENKIITDSLIQLRFWFFHEMAHVVLGHFQGAFSKEIELSADNFAVKYTMLTSKLNYEEMFNRLLMLSVFSLHTNIHTAGDTKLHPQASERFGNFMVAIEEYYEWTKDAENKSKAEAFLKKTALEFMSMAGISP